MVVGVGKDNGRSPSTRHPGIRRRGRAAATAEQKGKGNNSFYWESAEVGAANPEVELVMSRIAGLKRRLSLTPERQIDFSGIAPDESELPLGLRVVLQTDEGSSRRPVGVTRVSESTISFSVTFDQFVRLYFYLFFYRENPLTLDEVAASAQRVLHDAGIERDPVQVEVSLYRKMPGVYRRIGSGVSLFEAEYPIELHDLGRLFFHEESYPFLMIGNIAPYFTEEGALALEDVLTLKQDLIKTFSPRYQRRFMLFGSVVLFALGMRLPQNIDLLIDHLGASASFKRLIDSTYFHSQQRRVEAYCKGLGDWAEGQRDAYDQWFGNEWPRLLEVSSLHDLFAEPARHAYFLGLRLTTLRDDIRRRVCRERPAAFADLVALKRLPDISRYCAFDIPEFPDSYWANFQEFQLTAVDRAKFVRTINAYLKERYTFTLPEPTLWSLLSA